MKIGKFVSGTFNPLPTETYLTFGATAEHNQVYELRMETTPMTLAKEMYIVGELSKLNIPDMTVLGIDAHGTMVRMQIYSNQLTWLALIGILPSIIVPLVLLVIGAIIAIQIPPWVWALPFIGVGGGILIYAFMKGKGNKRG